MNFFLSMLWKWLEWSIFTYGNQGIEPNTIATHYHSPKATHKGKIWTKNWYNFLHLRQEDPSHLCTNDGNTNRGYYLPTNTYIGIVYLPEIPGHLVRIVTPPCTHPLRCDDLHLSGAYVCFTTKGRLFCFPKPYFFWKIAHNLRRIVYQSLK